MVQSAKTPELPKIEAHELHDPAAYVRAGQQLLNMLLAGKLEKSMDYSRALGGLKDQCLACTGVPYEDAAKHGQDPIRRFLAKGFFETCAAELDEVIAAVKSIDAIRATEAVKKKWVALLERLKALQEECRKDPAKFAVYVGSDDDAATAGDRFKMARCHIAMYDVWHEQGTHESYNHSLIQAPVGHAKSTSLRYYRCWRIGHNPERRCLYLTDSKQKAKKTVRVIRSILQSSRYLALFPDIRVMGREDDQERSNQQFTVFRKNEFARDATFEGLAIGSSIQGNRYEDIDADDFCTEDVRYYKTVRDKVTATWNGVVTKRLADSVNSEIRIICTPWHPEDTSGLIVKDHESGRRKDWRIEIDRFRIKDDSNGKAIPIWPEKWNSDYLESQKIDANYDFTYRLLTTSNKTQIVRRVQYYNADLKTKLTENDQKILDAIETWERWLSIDPAGGKATGRSHIGVVEICISPNGFVFVPRCWTWHCPMDETLEKLAELIMLWPVPGYEGVQWEWQGGTGIGAPVIMQSLERILREHGCARIPRMVSTDTRVGGYAQNRGKSVRLSTCASMLYHGCVRFAGTRLWKTVGDRHETYLTKSEGSDIDQLVSSILEFSESNCNDGVDALTQWVLNNWTRIKKPEGLETSAIADLPRKIGSTPVQTGTGLTVSFRKSVGRAGIPDPEPDESEIFCAA